MENGQCFGEPPFSWGRGRSGGDGTESARLLGAKNSGPSLKGNGGTDFILGFIHRRGNDGA